MRQPLDLEVFRTIVANSSNEAFVFKFASSGSTVAIGEKRENGKHLYAQSLTPDRPTPAENTGMNIVTTNIYYDSRTSIIFVRE